MSAILESCLRSGRLDRIPTAKELVIASHDGMLEIESRQQDEGWLVEVRGELDIATIETLTAELETRAPWPIVLDLSRVEFMDSTGIALLVRTAGRLTVGPVSPCVDRLIRMCGLETELTYN